MSSEKKSFARSVLDSCAVFLIGPIIAGIALAPIAEVEGGGLRTRNLILQFGVLSGAIFALFYFGISGRRFLKDEWERQISYCLMIVVYAAIAIAVSCQLLGLIE